MLASGIQAMIGRMDTHLLRALSEAASWPGMDWMGQAGEGVWPLWGILAVLALIDSTSFGTLLIPVWLLTAPGRLRASRVVIYLGVVAGAYALIGVALLVSLVLFGEQVLSWLSGARESGGVPIIQAALGAGLVWYSLRLDPMTAAGREKKRRREASRGGKDRVTRFRGRAVGDGTQGGIGPLLGLAVAAVGLEVATLIPYLAGIGLIAAASPGAPSSALMLLFYCMVMITPALVLLGGRVAAHRQLERPLARLEGLLSRHANGTIALILFLIGLFLSFNALEGLRELGVLPG